MRAFENFSSDIPRRDMPDNNFGRSRAHSRTLCIYSERATDGKESSKINDSVKFSPRFRVEDATD